MKKTIFFASLISFAAYCADTAGKKHAASDETNTTARHTSYYVSKFVNLSTRQESTSFEGPVNKTNWQQNEPWYIKQSQDLHEKLSVFRSSANSQ